MLELDYFIESQSALQIESVYFEPRYLSLYLKKPACSVVLLVIKASAAAPHQLLGAAVPTQ